MTTETNIEAALCLFGSVARGSDDAYSDKDLLVVSDNAQSIPQDVKDSWKAQNWSPAYYSWPRLIRKAVQGDLFIQHLKQEGVILADPSGRLKQVLQDFAPRPDYSDEVASSMIMLRVGDRKPSNIWQSQLICEVISRFFRYAIMRALASKQIYVFDYDKSLDLFSSEIHPLSDQDKATLLNLRRIQGLYNQRRKSDENVDGIREGAKNLATSIFDFEFFEIDAKHDARLMKPYSTLRDIEARITAYLDPVELDKGELLPDIWKLIKAPYYNNWAIGGQVSSQTLDSINIAISALE